MEKYGLLFESIFKRKLTDEDAAGYLKNITKAHPYFSVAQFYLLRLSQKNVNGYKNQARKTAVLFNNNHWLNFQLLEAGFDNNNGTETVITPLSFPEKIADDVLATKNGNRSDDERSAETYSSAQARYDAVVEEAPNTNISKKIEIEEEIKAEESGAEEPVVINAPLIAGENNTVDEVVNDETADTTFEKNESAALMEAIAIEEEIKAEESGAEEPVVINEPLIVGDNNTVEEVVSGETAILEADIKTVDTTGEDNNMTIEDVVVDESEPAAERTSAETHFENDEAVAAKENAVAEDNTVVTGHPVNEEIPVIAAVSQALTTEDRPIVTEEQTTRPGPDVAEKALEPEALLFEPLHTSDYFASVGIKLSEEEKTTGNLGKQLKSFTDWLKTMKKVHAEQLAKTSSPMDVNLSATESSIQKMAEKSNQENDVITEAMSDVLLQQGKADKAVEILEKLSLLNPGKSAYFAAKINQIKDK